MHSRSFSGASRAGLTLAALGVLVAGCIDSGEELVTEDASEHPSIDTREQTLKINPPTTVAPGTVGKLGAETADATSIAIRAGEAVARDAFTTTQTLERSRNPFPRTNPGQIGGVYGFWCEAGCATAFIACSAACATLTGPGAGACVALCTVLYDGCKGGCSFQ